MSRFFRSSAAPRHGATVAPGGKSRVVLVAAYGVVAVGVLALDVVELAVLR